MTTGPGSEEDFAIMRVLRGTRDRIGAGLWLACGWMARRKELPGKATADGPDARDDWRRLGEF